MSIQTERFLWLLSRKLSGEISEEEARELEAIMRANNRLRREQELLDSFWKNNDDPGDNISSKEAFDRLVARMNAQDNGLWPEMPARTKSSGKWWLRLSRVAALLLLLAGSFYIIKQWLGDGLRAEHNVRGTRSQIKLADGTTVWLNADSELKYPRRFKGSTREVYLRGEAYFDVAKDAAHPFIVHTDKMNIHVLGTSFNVRSYPGDSVYEATLITGEVEVTLSRQPDKKIRLLPHEKLTITDQPDSTHMPQQSAAIPVISAPTYFAAADSAIVETAWIDNKLIFNDESFASLASRMERWYNVTIRFENKEIQQLRFTGLFNKETLTQAMEALQITEHFNYRQEDDTIIIY